MQVERKCMSCRLSADNPDVTADLRLEALARGGVPRLCLARPPQWVTVPTPQGWTMTMMFPTVNAQSTSCADFEPEFLNG